MADDLGEEWWLEDNQKSNQEDEVDIPDKKRQAEDSDDDEDVDGVSQSADKKKKKRKRRKITEELQQKQAAPPSPQDLISELQKYFEDKLSPVELDELHLQDEHFATCNDLSHTPVSYLKSVLPKWKKMCKSASDQKGAPLLLIITSSALRAVQLNRDISDFKGDECRVIKLFAKHIKVNEQIKLLQKTAVHLGIGTPNRILALFEQGGLNLDCTTHVIIDWTWRDVKSWRLIDKPEIKTDLMKLLQKYLISQCKKGQTKIGLL